MPATTPDGWPYILPADHPLEYPTHSQQLANLLDTKVGPGLIVHSEVVSLPDIAVTTSGVRDVASIGQTVTFPYATKSLITSTMFGGFATGTTDFTHDLYGFAAAAVLKAAGVVQSPAGKWTSSPLTWGWANAAGASVGCKVRCNVTAMTAGHTFHSGGATTLLVIQS